MIYMAYIYCFSSGLSDYSYGPIQDRTISIQHTKTIYIEVRAGWANQVNNF